MKSVLVFLVLAPSLWARVLHVPSMSYPTIQAGLDSLAAHDTVLVALGTYGEALYAPALPFVLLGDVIPDTGDYPRPIIDPAPLSGSDTLACLTIQAGADPFIREIHFRNGPAMYPHFGYWGGVVVHGNRAEFTGCLFDSLFGGVHSLLNPCSLRITDCRFMDVFQHIGGVHLNLYARNCLFAGVGAMWIGSSEGTWLEQCQFMPANDNAGCEFGGDVHITDCQFGPLPDGEWYWSEPLRLESPNGVVQHNLFTGLRTGLNGIISVYCACDSADSISIRHNHFVHNRSDFWAGSTGLAISCQDNQSDGCGAAVDSNIFEDNQNCSRNRGVTMTTGGRIAGNRFRHLETDTSYHDTAPVRAVVSIVGSGTADVYGNRFDSTGLAFWDGREYPYDTLDLRNNWWGSASGPYHAYWNPQGSGDTVLGNYLRIDPWCIDTACALAADPPFILHSSSFLLSAYPNPFNSTTVLHLEVPEPQIVRVELFNLLGRRIQELWSGVVADRQEIAFDGSALASGIYFVRATNTIWNRPLITAKLVLLK